MESKKERKQQTTAQSFAYMREEIMNYSPSNSFGKSLQTLNEEYNHCIEVLKTLSKRDLIMLWHIHNGFTGIGFYISNIAKKQYQIKKALDALE